MENRFKQALEGGHFAVTCEIIPGRGAHESSLARELENACDIYATGRVDAISVTDNPGGNPALLADAAACELAERGVNTLVHFTCKDRSRNQMISQLYHMERAGLENLLFMTGDYQASGWMGRARPVFDLDSVQVQMLAREMNEGLVVSGPRETTREAGAHFFAGGVVNPFKYREGEIVPQLLKAEKKLLAGARFLVCQLGYDARKLDELARYLRGRGHGEPLIANVFLLTRGAARLMRAGSIAGCYVSDALAEKLEREFSESDDKGKAARIERAAIGCAIAKGIGFSGVHIGGFGLDAQSVCAILDRADELAGDWRELAARESWPAPGGQFLYEPAQIPQATCTAAASGKEAQPRQAPENIGTEDIRGRKLFKSYRLSRFFHHWMLTLGKRGGKLLERRMDRKERKHGGPGFPHRIEHLGKTAIYGCLDCGDCGLEACVYTCPMARCPKCQRNGPCGGSTDGWCEVYPDERYCIWYMAYHRLSAYGELWRMTSFTTPPNDWALFETSAWSNYTHKRDNCAKRIPVQIGPDEWRQDTTLRS